MSVLEPEDRGRYDRGGLLPPHPEKMPAKLADRAEKLMILCLAWVIICLGTVIVLGLCGVYA